MAEYGGAISRVVLGLVMLPAFRALSGGRYRIWITLALRRNESGQAVARFGGCLRTPGKRRGPTGPGLSGRNAACGPYTFPAGSEGSR